MRRLTPYLLLLTLVGIQASCERKPDEPVVIDYAEAQERLIEANRNRVRSERTDIDTYIQQKGWPVDTTGTGLRYWVNHRGAGAAATRTRCASHGATCSTRQRSLVKGLQNRRLASGA